MYKTSLVTGNKATSNKNQYYYAIEIQHGKRSTTDVSSNAINA